MACSPDNIPDPAASSDLSRDYALARDAADPLAGSIVLMETARAFAEAADRGERPDRTILFAAWGAEEFGIIGSTEWVEAHAEEVAGRLQNLLDNEARALTERLVVCGGGSVHGEGAHDLEPEHIGLAWSRTGRGNHARGRHRMFAEFIG